MNVTATTTTSLDTELSLEDDDLFGGDGKVCEWRDDICTETPTNFTVSFCDDPDCKQRHTNYFCPRHYVLELDRLLNHLRECPGYDDCHSPEEYRSMTLEHIADFGSIE